MKYPKRSQYKYAKSPYRIRNWPQYEAGLRRRGDLTVWFFAKLTGTPVVDVLDQALAALARLWA